VKSRPVQIWKTLVLALVLVLPVAACDRNIAPYEPGEQPRAPDLSRIFPDDGGPDRAAEARATSGTPVAQETSRVGSAKGETIRGEVRLAGVEAPPGATLFVIARTKGARGGPPLAVLRVPSPRFPHAFELGQTNVMIPSMRFAGEMDLTARLDVDGNAMTKVDDDLEGRAMSAHAPGDRGVVIELQ
jgi:hypothetical protein